MTRWVGARSATSAALVTAVLIGDRAAIPDDVRDTLRAAGTYHVIAISGGNIAVFVVLVSALGALAGLGPRPAAALTIGVLLAYAALVVSGPSVRRAVLVAVVYLSARTIDHRAPAWHAASIACAGVLVAWPLDLLDAGFVLTFGAAAALLAASPVVRALSVAAPLRALLLAVAASAAVEAVLLPVQALVFSRVTLAGIALNLVAVPLMAVAQMGGLAVVALDLCGASASWPAWAADVAVQDRAEQRACRGGRAVAVRTGAAAAGAGRGRVLRRAGRGGVRAPRRACRRHRRLGGDGRDHPRRFAGMAP